MSMSGKLDGNKKLAVGLVVAGAVGAAAWLAYKRAHTKRAPTPPPSPAKEPETEHVEQTLPDETGERKRITSTSTPPGEKELPREEQHYAAEDSPPEENNGSLTTTEQDGVVFVDRKPTAGEATESANKPTEGASVVEDMSFDGSIISDKSIEEAKLATQEDCGTPHGCGEEETIVAEAAVTTQVAPSPAEATPSHAEDIPEAKFDRVEEIIKAEHAIHKEASVDSGHESDTVEGAVEEQIIQESVTEPEAAIQPAAEPEAAIVPEAAVESEAALQPEATIEPEVTLQPESAAEAEASVVEEHAEEPKSATEPEATLEPVTAETTESSAAAETEANNQPDIEESQRETAATDIESHIENQIVDDAESETAPVADVPVESKPAAIVENGHGEDIGEVNGVEEPVVEAQESSENETVSVEEVAKDEADAAVGESNSAPWIKAFDGTPMNPNQTSTNTPKAGKHLSALEKLKKLKEEKESQKPEPFETVDEPEPVPEPATSEASKAETPVVPMRNKNPKKTANAMPTPKAPYADFKEDSSQLNGTSELETVED